MNTEIANKSNPPVRIMYTGIVTRDNIFSLPGEEDPIQERHYSFRFEQFPQIHGNLFFEEPTLDDAEIMDVLFCFHLEKSCHFVFIEDQTIPMNFVDVLPQIVLKQDGYESTVFDFVKRLANGARSFVPTK